jgi:ionotropic kainate glutamate receptor 2
MTAFRMVDADDLGVREILKDMEKFQPYGHTLVNKSKIQVRPIFSQRVFNYF